MKICWDNLEKLEYKNGFWYDNKRYHYYIYKDSCKNCGELFLAQKGSKGFFCNYFCVNKNKNHANWKGGVTNKNIPLYDTYAHQISYCEEVRRNKQDPNVLEMKCAYCGKWYTPTRQNVDNRINAANGILSGEHRLYCSKQCKKECPIYHKIKYQVGHPKSNKSQYSREVQPELRQMCFERDKFTCQKCGKTQDELETGLHCHHIEGIRWEPLESADLDKVITFCKNCHVEVHKQPDCGYHDMRCS